MRAAEMTSCRVRAAVGADTCQPGGLELLPTPMGSIAKVAFPARDAYFT